MEFVNLDIKNRFEKFENKDVALRLRGLIYSLAEELGHGKVEASLKWNQPSFVVKYGAALRIAETKNTIGLYVSCQTTIIDTLKPQFPELECDKTRGLIMDPKEEIPEAATSLILAAMTYKKK